MGFLFRRSKNIGGFRLTLSNSGMGVSYGKGPFRISRGATGRTQTNIRTPLRGLRYNIQHGRNASARKVVNDYAREVRRPDIRKPRIVDRTAENLRDIRARAERLQGGPGAPGSGNLPNSSSGHTVHERPCEPVDWEAPEAWDDWHHHES